MDHSRPLATRFKRLFTPIRIWLPLLFAALIVTSEGAAQGVAVGTRAGLNLATADVEGSLFDQDVGSRIGFHAGLLGSVDITSNLAVQTEFLFTRKGFGSGDGDVELQVDYFEIPVLAVLKIPGRLSPHLNLGVFLGLETSCTASTVTVEDANCSDIATGPSTQGADSGVVLGGGVSLDIGFGSLLIDILYNYGLTDFSEATGGVDSIKTRSLYLSAGLTRPLGSGR